MSDFIIPGHRARKGQALTAYLEGGSDVDELRQMQLQAVAEAVNGHPHFYGARWSMTPDGGVITANTVGNPIPLVPALYVALGGIGVFTILKIGEGISEGIARWGIWGFFFGDKEGIADVTAGGSPFSGLWSWFWPDNAPASNTISAGSEGAIGPTRKPAPEPAMQPTAPVIRQTQPNPGGQDSWWDWLKRNFATGS